MSYFMDYSETRKDEDLKEIDLKCYDDFLAVNSRLGENGQVIPEPSFVDTYSYSRLHAIQNPVDIQQQIPHLMNNTQEVDDFFLSGFYSLHTPENKNMRPFTTHNEISTSQQGFGTFSSIPEEVAESTSITNIEMSSRIPLNAKFEGNLNSNEHDAFNVSSYKTPVEHQVTDQLGEIYPRELDYQQLSDSLQTPPCKKSEYQIYSSYSSLTPPDYYDQSFPSVSWLSHDSPSLSISEGMVEKKASRNSSERCLKTKLSCESFEISKDATSTTNSTKSKQPRHYSSVADISSVYQRRKQLNRHKIGQYRSVSPCLQIRKRRSAKGLKANEPCRSSVGKGVMTGFVNYTPEDSEKILTGVAPSGSNKTKARRDREAFEKRQRLSQAALRAVEAVGGDISGLVEEEFFVQN